MSKSLFLPLSIVGLTLLSACGGREPAPIVVVPPAPVVTAPPSNTSSAPAVVQSVALRPGMGRIENIGPATMASAGGSTPASMQRLNIRMDDGTMQVVDTPSSGLSIGDRVELTREGWIRRHPPQS